MRQILCTAIVAGISLLAVPAARASYHTFRFDEIYSNSDGTVQFIELHESFAQNFQNLFTLAPDLKETASSHTFTFATNLTSTTTANRFVLLGTAAFAAIPGAPAPDYIIPANFFNPAGDTLQFGSTGPDGIVDTITWTGAPTDGIHSFLRTGITGSVFTSAINSPTDLAGNTGSVPEPASLALLGLGAVALVSRRRAR